MKRLDELRDISSFYTSLLDILEDVRQPTSVQYDTINLAKAKLIKEIERANTEINKLEKAASRLYKHFRLIITLLLITFVISTVVFTCITVYKVNNIYAIIPLLFLVIIQVVAIIMLDLNTKTTKAYLVFLMIGFVAMVLTYVFEPTFTGGTMLTLALQFISFTNFAFGLHEKLKKK